MNTIKTLCLCATLIAATGAHANLPDPGTTVVTQTLLQSHFAEGTLIEFTTDTELPTLSVRYDAGVEAIGTTLILEKDTTVVVIEDRRETDGTIVLQMNTDEKTPEVPSTAVVAADDLARLNAASNLHVYQDDEFADSEDPDQADAMASDDEYAYSEITFDAEASRAGAHGRHRRSSRINSVCKMKRNKKGKLYKQCYCYHFVKAAVAGRVTLTGDKAKNAYGQLRAKKGWSRVSFGATRIGDLCTWGGKGAGHIAVKKACGWYWGKCDKTGSHRPLLGCFHQNR